MFASFSEMQLMILFMLWFPLPHLLSPSKERRTNHWAYFFVFYFFYFCPFPSSFVCLKNNLYIYVCISLFQFKMVPISVFKGEKNMFLHLNHIYNNFNWFHLTFWCSYFNMGPIFAPIVSFCEFCITLFCVQGKRNYLLKITFS